LPEVNAVTRAGLAAREHKGRELAFREVYQIPGMVKVNQALGRLVRGPGQRAKVLLHGKRLAEASYQNLLAPDFRAATELRTAEAVSAWWRE
jgi:Rad3-related DNA helicase